MVSTNIIKKLFGKQSGYIMQHMAATIASISMLSAGTFYGWINPVLNLLESPDSPIPMTAVESSWVASLPELGTLITSLPAGFIADSLGRKYVMLLTAPLSIASWIVIAYTHDISILIAARLVQGLVVGVSSTVLPMYLSEIAEPAVRGRLGSMFILSFTLGQVFEYAIGPFVSFSMLAVLTTIPSWFFLVAFYWFHESPYYLLLTGKHEKAKVALESFRDGSVDEELERMRMSIDEEKKSKDGWKSAYNTAIGRKALLISGIINVTIFMTGFSALISYSSTIFLNTTGMGRSSDMFTLGMGVILVFFTASVSYTLEKWGRVATMLWSHWLSAVLLIVTGMYFFLQTLDIDVSSWWIVPVIGVILTPTTSLSGISACKVYQTELFNTSSRGFASGVNTLICGLASAATVLMFVPLKIEGLIYVNFFVFALFSIVGAIFLHAFCPETKGKTFEEIQKMLSNS